MASGLDLALGYARRRRSVILAYHGIGAVPIARDPDRLLLARARLLGQVRAMRHAGFEFVTVEKFAGRIASRGASGAAALSFDDGLMDNLEPLLELAAGGIPATVFPVLNWLGKRHPSIDDYDAAQMLDANALKELAAAGVEIGGHTRDHPDLTSLSFADCLAELQESRAALEDLISVPVKTLAYPYGRHSPDVRRAARVAGYEVAVAEEAGIAGNRFALERAAINSTQGEAIFALKVLGVWSEAAYGRAGRAARALTRPARRALQSYRDRRAFPG